MMDNDEVVLEGRLWNHDIDSRIYFYRVMWIGGRCHQPSIRLHYFHLAKVVAEVIRRFPYGKTTFKS